MKKNVVKINESQLRKMIAEGVKQALNGGDEFEQLWEEFEDWMDSYNQADYPTCYGPKQIARHFYELGKKGETLNESGGYDMSTPEGRRGAEDWMNYIMDQEDRRPAIAAKNWAEEHGLGWDENVIEAFIAGVDYARNN
jgi:hypothetical protein